MLIYKANVVTPPPMSSPIRIVPGCFTASTSSMEKSNPPLLFGPAHRVFSLPSRSKQSLQSSNPLQASRERVVFHTFWWSGWAAMAARQLLTAFEEDLLG